VGNALAFRRQSQPLWPSTPATTFPTNTNLYPSSLCIFIRGRALEIFLANILDTIIANEPREMYYTKDIVSDLN